MLQSALNADFLLADLDAALALARLALDARLNCERRLPNISRVAEAYDTALRQSQRVRFTQQRHRRVEAKLDELKKLLIRLQTIATNHRRAAWLWQLRGQRLVDMDDIVRCPYCVLGDNFRPMLERPGWYVCERCGHTILPYDREFLCKCRRCQQLRAA